MAYGLINADQIGTSVANTSLGAGDASLMKNRILNGSMVIDQRNSGSSVTANDGVFPVDRFSFSMTQSSKGTGQQNQGSVTPPVGFSNYLGFTSSSAYSVLSSDQFAIRQYIEGFNTSDLGFGTANAKTITLSFQVYSSLTGTFGGALQNNAANRSYPFTYSIPTANTWTSISITIAGDTTGTWIGATNGTGLRVFLSLGMGSTYSGTAGSWAGANYQSATGATSVVGTNGATFYITGVQLEVGSIATGYEYRQFGQEIALCQRYCVKYGNDGINAAYNKLPTSGYTQSGTTAIVVFNLGTPMRTTPSISYTGSWTIIYPSGSATISSYTVDQGSFTSPSFIVNSSGMTSSQPCLIQANGNSSFYTLLSAEL